MPPPRSRMKRRLLILATSFLILVFVLGSLYIYRKHRIAEHFLHLRAVGLAAVKAGDYPTGVNDLGAYLGQYPSDLPSLEAYAKASLKVPQPKGRNLFQAIGVLHQILYQLPGNLKYQKMLLKLLVQTNANVEAVALAHAILQKDPRNLTALSALADTLTRLRKLKEAFTYASRCVEISPDRLMEGLLAIDLMRQQQLPNRQVTAWAQNLVKKNPTAPTYQFLQAAANLVTGHVARATTLILRLSRLRHLPEVLILPLVNQLDRLNLSKRATVVLRHAVADGAQKDILQALCDRLYQHGHNHQVLAITKTVNAANNEILAAYKARSLLALHEKSAARAIIAELKKISTPAAQNWAAVLALRLNQNVTDATRISVLKTAQATFPDQPYFLYRLGNAYQRAGEPEIARQYWLAAASAALTWPQPLERLAMESVGSGDAAFARTLMRRAIKLAPDSHRIQVAQAIVRAMGTPLNPKNPPAALLTDMADLAHQKPVDSDLVITRIRVYLQLGQTAVAKRLLIQSLRMAPPLPQTAFLALYSISRNAQLGLGATILAQAKHVYGKTPAIILARALRLAGAKHPNQGLTLLRQNSQKSGPDAAQWRLALAEYLSLQKNPAAAKAWKQAVAISPDNTRAQWLAIESPIMQNDRKFVLGAFDRLEKIIGNRGFAWKLSKAGWLLSHKPTSADLKLVVKLLHEDIQESTSVLGPHLLLASVYQKQRKITQAINQLQVAYALTPRNPGLALALAQLYQKQGRMAHAQQYLADVADSSYATPAQQKQAATLFALDGHNGQAITLLEKQAQSQKLGLARSLLLAQLYQREGNTAAAETLFARLLKKPDAAVLAAAANFYGDQGNLKKAQTLLKRLAKIRLPAGEADLIAGDFYMNHNMGAQARDAYNAAVEAAPKRRSPWFSLLNFELALNDSSAVKATLAAAIGELPHSATLQFLNNNLPAVLKVNKSALFRRLVAALLRTPTANGAQPVVLALADALAGKPTNSAISTRLQSLVTEYPHYLNLRNATAKVLLATGQAADAASLAIRTMAKFPADPSSARIATLAYLRMRQWASCLNAAQQWRRRMSGDRVAADVVMATADINLEDPASAISRLTPYLAAAKTNPDQLHQVLILAAQADILSGNPLAARRLLWPPAKISANVRIGAMPLAADTLPLKSATQWLNYLNQYITPGPKGNVEQLALAQGWWALGQRFNSAGSMARAEKLIRSLLASGQKFTKAQKINLLSDLATIELVRGQNAQAMGIYNQVLSLAPSQTVALNNLAILLLRQTPPSPAGIERAAILARRAIKLAPQSPTLWDTLARVQAAEGKYPQALASMAKAKALDPNNPLWPVDTAAILLASGNTAGARSVLTGFRPDATELQELSVNARKHYRQLQAQLRIQ